MTEAGGDAFAAVDAGETSVRIKAAQLQRLFDDRGEVLFLPNMSHAGEGDDLGGEHPVSVAGLGRHQAVGGEQNGRGQICKFLLLILPGGAEIALEMGIFLKSRIGMGRQHLAMGIDVDAFALGLLQKQLTVLQVMPGDDDKGAFLHGQGHGGGHGVTIGFSVGLVQQRHALEVHLAHLHDNRQQLFHAPVLADGKQALIEEAVHFLVGIAQHHGMVCVGRHAPQTEENQRFQGTDVFVGFPEKIHVVFVGSAAGGCASIAIRRQRCLFPAHHVNLPTDGFFIEIHIGQGGEQPFDDCPMGGRGGYVRIRCPGKTD